MHHPTDRRAHTTAFVTPVVEHWLEREIAQWVHPMKDRSDDPSHHERTLLPPSYIPLPRGCYFESTNHRNLYNQQTQICLTPLDSFQLINLEVTLNGRNTFKNNTNKHIFEQVHKCIKQTKYLNMKIISLSAVSLPIVA